MKAIAKPEGTRIETLSARFEAEGYPCFVLTGDSWSEIDESNYTIRYTDDTTDSVDETEYVFAKCGPTDGEPEIDNESYPRRLIATPLDAQGYRDELNQLVFAY